MATMPVWMAELEDEDLTFIKKFILASGSLKEVAALYGVSYPTVRLRLDRLIQKIQLTETAEADPYVCLVKRLAVDDKLDFDTAKLLITEYRRTKEEICDGDGNKNGLADTDHPFHLDCGRYFAADFSLQTEEQVAWSGAAAADILILAVDGVGGGSL